MIKDLQKIVFLENDKKKAGMSDSFFRSYALRKDLGNRILKGIFSRTTVDENNVRHFLLDDVEKRTGFLSDVYGCVGVFSLINRMNVKLTKEQKADLMGTVDWILDYIKNNGYTMDPYITSDDFFNEDTPFYGAMTWSLSLLANLCRSMREGYFEFDDRKKNQIYKSMARIIEAFNNGARIDNTGKCIGWGFYVDGVQPSLFYTYSVLEAFSDFEDSVLGGEDVDFAQSTDNTTEEDTNFAIGSRDEELIRYLKEHVNSRTAFDGTEMNGLKYWRESCFEAALNVWNKAKDIIKHSFVGDNFFTEDNVVPEIKEADIMKSSTSNALINTLFVVFTGIYGYVNKENQSKDGDNLDEVMDTMREALQNVQKTYDLLAQRGMEYIVDSYSLLFQSGMGKQGTDFERKCSSRLNSENIFDSSLLPLLVKSNSMMAFYIQQFPQKQMGELFEKLFDKISLDAWNEGEYLIWDGNKYNVKNTERYLEAVADFYDYFDVYEKSYVKNKEQNEATIAARLEKEKPVWKQEVDKELRAEYDTQFKLWQAEEVRKHQFEQIFSAEIKRIANEAFEEKLLSSIDNIITARLTNSEDELTSFESALSTKLGDLLLSSMDKHLRANNYRLPVKELKHALSNDIDNFMQTYAQHIAKAAEKDQTDILSKLIFTES